MKKQLPHKYYGTCERNVQGIIKEVFAEKAIPADDIVRLIGQMVEEIDIRPLMKVYSDIGRKPATHPRTMLKVTIYAGMEHIYSSRNIQKACQRNMNFIWLLNGVEAPNYHEITRFRSLRLSQCGEVLFYQIVQMPKEYGEIEYEHLFVDGTKIEANANKYGLVWKKSTNKYEARVDAQIEKLLPELRDKHGVLVDSVEEKLLGAMISFTSKNP